MMTALIIIGAILWFAIGAGSFIYVWTMEKDLKMETLLLVLLYGIIGPISIIPLSLIWADNKSVDGKFIIIKKRKSKQ